MSFIQGAKNFLGGINDTMNLPAVAIGELGAFFSPRGSKAEYYFNDFANSARNTSDMGQNRGSVGYILGRAAPGLAVYGALPAAGALPALGFAGVETAGLSTLGSFFDGDVARAYNWQQNGNGIYANRSHGSAPTSLTGRKLTYDMNPAYYNQTIALAEKPSKYLIGPNGNIIAKTADPYPYVSRVVQAQQGEPSPSEPKYYSQVAPVSTNRTQAKKMIVNELSNMSKNGTLGSNPSRTQKLIDLYNKVK